MKGVNFIKNSIGVTRQRIVEHGENPHFRSLSFHWTKHWTHALKSVSTYVALWTQ